MNRERELAKTFVDLADTCAPQFDPYTSSTGWCTAAGNCWRWTRQRW